MGDHLHTRLTANPPDISVDGWDLAAPTVNRMLHLDWHFDADAWLSGVVTGFADYEAPNPDSMVTSADSNRIAQVRGAVTAFLSTRVDLISPKPPTDPSQAGRAWPSPRSWDNAMSVLAHVRSDDDEARLLALAGCVGDGAAREYLAFEATADLVDPRQLLASPSQIRWDRERPDRLFALLRSVEALVRLDVTGGKTSTWAKGMAVMCACAEGNRPDVAVPSVRRIIAIKPEGEKFTSEMRTHFLPLFQRMGRITDDAAA